MDIPGTPRALQPGAGFFAGDFLKLSAIVCVKWSDKPAPTTSTSICNVSRATLANTWSIPVEVGRVILVGKLRNYFFLNSFFKYIILLVLQWLVNVPKFTTPTTEQYLFSLKDDMRENEMNWPK